ncbi:hypothetical protein BV22DRAFT_1191002 [Leucogyrophana mollusca]|uniref:Uncharacterized protein n=1 Tax=Leucogyrophana mollusca TaxID=85980 RepID=A0ACB8BYY6_9AGAM|nr:hypothetical protein BV22DRAFT_1191002 [Leucogyrophana mollusca]
MMSGSTQSHTPGRVDSDAAVFARNAYTLTPSRGPNTHINALPPELLIIIFKIVFKKYRYADGFPWHLGGLGIQETPYRSRWDRADMLSPTLFPFSIASVCRYWQCLMSSVPIFWTRLVILVDSRHTPLSLVKSYLEWSKDLPIDVFVTRRRTDQDENDTREKARVDAVMQHLLHHLHRLRSLRFNVMRRSSLPSLIAHFQGAAPKLRRLNLECKLDDRIGTGADTMAEWNFSTPVLQELSLDGRNFCDVYVSNPGWFHQLQLRRFTLSRYKPLSAYEAISLYSVLDALAAVRSIDSLTIKDMEFDQNAPRRRDIELYLNSITLEDLGGDVVSEIFHAVDTGAESTTIKRCSLASFQYVSGYHLSLEDIDAEWDLTGVLREWSGRELYLYNCPGFNDGILAAMRDGGRDDIGFMCADLRNVALYNCNFSPAALKAMVEARWRVSKAEVEWNSITDTDVEDFETVAPIADISVHGGGPLSPEEEQWFIDHTGLFDWYEDPVEKRPNDADDPDIYGKYDDYDS